MIALEPLGWSPVFAGGLLALGDAALVPARVLGERRGVYTVADGRSERSAAVAGRLRHRLASPGELPTVGDWVALGAAETGRGTATIRAVLPRRTAITRRAAGERHAEQVLAANVDTAVVLMGLDGDYNLRRLERYLAMVRGGGSAAAVLLTKADLSPDGAADRVREVEEMAPGTPVAAMALLAAERLPDLLAERLRAGHTLVLLGSSGVGKSTLLNRLAGRVLQRTASVRARDSRGRHTTSYRQMFPIAGGALVIDTPGLREIHLVETEVPASLEAVFPEIAAAGAGCRFRDCRHAGEPGCALPGAVTAGAVLAERLASYRRLRAEREGRGPGPSRRSRRPR